MLQARFLAHGQQRFGHLGPQRAQPSAFPSRQDYAPHLAASFAQGQLQCAVLPDHLQQLLGLGWFGGFPGQAQDGFCAGEADGKPAVIGEVELDSIEIGDPVDLPGKGGDVAVREQSLFQAAALFLPVPQVELPDCLLYTSRCV